MKTTFRKSIDKELESKLLLQDASFFQILKQLHRNHHVVLFESIVIALGVGVVIGVVV